MFGGLCLHVIDPLNRTGKVAIPAHNITDTKGLEDYRAAAAKREDKDFSLCLLFQKGRCNAGSRCHQIHASPEFVEELRRKAASTKNCCAAHGDVHSHGYLDACQTVVLIDNASIPTKDRRFSMSAFARTAAFDKILSSVKAPEVRIPANKICRLHTQRRCKFGKDCKNLHLCPDAAELPLVNIKKGGCPSIDMCVDCDGISTRGASSKPSSLADSPNTLTPRCGLSKDTGAFSASLSPEALLPCDSSATFATGNGCSSFFLSEDHIWGTVMETSTLTADLDMSAFEATIRVLCDDLDRAEHSPGSALRVRSQGRLFAELTV